MTDELTDNLIKADCLAWCEHSKLKLNDGVRFELAGRPYLDDIVNCDKRVMSVIKGSQVCLTTAKFLEAVHGCYFRHFEKNIIYMLPTVKQAETLSKISFDPIFQYNPFLKKKLNSNSASLKTINGRSIVFVGAQSQKVGDSTAKDSVNLRSIPADIVYRDEIDLMDPDMVEISKQRLNASRHRIECNFASPIVPGFGIDQLWTEGDMRYFQIRCSHCGKYTCLGRDFPNSLLCVNNVWRRSCVHCQNEIHTQDGRFEAEYPNRRNASFWVDGFVSPMADLEGYMYRYNNPKNSAAKAEFERSILGQATIEASCQLSETDVRACCSNQGMSTFSDSECCVGVDTGNKLHVVAGYRTAPETYRVIHNSCIDSKDAYAELYDLCDKLNAKTLVIDNGPDIHAVRKFQNNTPWEVFRNIYSETQYKIPQWDHNDGIVKCNRNEWCDKVHGVVTTQNLVIPRRCYEIDQFATSMTKTAKETKPHPETGIPKTRWLKVGDKEDHYFHATLYFLLACSQRSPVVDGHAKKPIKVVNKFYV